MTTETITEYRQLLAGARRNFALCVLEVQAPFTTSAHQWRKKADRLQSAIRRAERLAHVDLLDAAVTLLRRESEPS